MILIGRHCCLWCEIIGDKLVVPRGERGRSSSRTLQRLRDDHQRFLVNGGGDIKKAKFYNNAITKYFFDIPINSVCTLYKVLALHRFALHRFAHLAFT